MNILIVAATDLEIKPLAEQLDNKICLDKGMQTFKTEQLDVDVLITGVGLMHTAYHLTKVLTTQKYDLVFNFGIAGSFKDDYKIGDVVNIVREELADFGAEDDENFIDVFDLGLLELGQYPYTDKRMHNPHKAPVNLLEELPKVNGISVNKAHGNIKNIEKAVYRCNPDVESLEGAAIFYCCLMEKIPFFEIRGISNHIEKRNKEKWNIPLAVENLNITAFKIFNEICELTENNAEDNIEKDDIKSNAAEEK